MQSVEKSPLFFSIQSDVNGTITFADATKKCDPLRVAVSDAIIGQWAEGLEEMTYKNYVLNVLHKGDRYETSIKEKQEATMGKFIEDLKEKNHPLYEKAYKLYQQIAEKYLDPETKKVKCTLFPSMIRLINTISKVSDYTLTLRTFGHDGTTIAQELNQLSQTGAFGEKGLELHRYAQFTEEGLQIRGETTIEQGEKLFHELQKSHLVGQDQFKNWREHKGEAAYGKRIYCVEDGKFEGRDVITLFLDDNLKKSLEEKTDQPTDPKEENIAFPVDIYDRPTSWNSPGIIGIRVNSIEAALNEDYFVKQVNAELIKRHLTPLV